MTSTTAPIPLQLPIRELIASVLRGWRLFLLIALPLPIGVAVWSLLTPDEYKAGASFMPQEPNNTPLGLGALASQLGIAAAGRGGGSPQFYADLLQTKTLLRAAALATYDITEPETFHGTLVQYFGNDGDDEEKNILATIKELDERLVVTSSRNTGVVSLEVTTASAELSAKIVERFLALLTDFNQNRRRFVGRAEREFLDERVASAESSLVAAEDRLANFLRRNRSIANSPELQAEQSRLERWISLRHQALGELTQALEAARTDEVRNTPVITMVERVEDSIEPAGWGTALRVLVALAAGGVLATAVFLFRTLRAKPATVRGSA
jgi:uncharacterized protein involved in exopolysaccharide biosynthesis